MQKPRFIDKSLSRHDQVLELVDFAAWCRSSQGNTVQTISNKISAVKYFHLVDAGVELPTEADLLKRQFLGMQRTHVQRRALTRVRLPITLHELRAGAGGDRLMVDGGRTLELCLTLAFFIGARPLEIFKSDQGLVHPVNCLTRGDVAFFDAHGQLFGGDISRATRFELLFRGHKGDQAQKGTVLVRTREAASGTHARLEADGGAVAALVELCLLEAELPSSAPLAAFTVGMSYQVWSYRQATRALRQIAERAGMDQKRISLHSLRIGSATVLASGGVSERIVQREGRWKSSFQMYSVYTRNNLTDPGIGTKWN